MEITFATVIIRDTFLQLKKTMMMMKRDRNKKTKEKCREYSEGKIQCLICKEQGIDAWYNKVGGHVRYAHKITAREYKRRCGYDVIKGLLSPKSRDIARKRNSENYDKVVGQNLLKKGKDSRFAVGKKFNYKRSRQTLERLKQQSFLKLEKTKNEKKNPK